jgi:PKD repeat protein
MKKPFAIGFIALLLLSIALVVTATPWDGVPDNPTPAEAIWVDPKNTTGLALDDVFTVDVLINITDPPGAGTGLYGFQYKLKWNSTVLEVVEIQTHTDNVPPGDLLLGWTSVYVAANDTGPISGSSSGYGNHSYSVAAIAGTAFTGVDSLCTYKFKVLWQPGESEPNWNGTLDLYDDILVDDTATPIDPHTTVDGEYWVLAMVAPVADFTWSPTTPKVGDVVTFDASASTPDGGEITSWDWDFNDTTTGTGEIVTHTYTATGTYSVNLTVTDSEGLTNSTTKSITITKASTTITISASPTTIEIGEDTTISGSITPTRVGVTVAIHYRLTGGTWAILANVTTVSTGYSYTWTPSALGTYEVNASWPGDANYLAAESSVTTVTVTKISSAISIFASPETLKVDENTTISGSITPARSGVTVTISFRLSGETTWNTTTVTTNATGGYSYTWTPDEAGDYEFKASWAGDTNTLGDESSTITVTVEEAAAALPSYLLYLAIIIIVIVIAAIAIYFLKIKKKS